MNSQSRPYRPAMTTPPAASTAPSEKPVAAKRSKARKMPWLDSCCGFISLKVGTVISGLLGIIVGGATLILVLSTKVKMRTIVIDTLPSDIVKIILAINLVMTIVISILLIIGALKRNRWMMLPWVILAIMLAIGMAVSIIYTAVVFFTHGDAVYGGMWLLGLFGIAIFIYLWFVVFSYYQMLEEEKGRGPYKRPPRR